MAEVQYVNVGYPTVTTPVDSDVEIVEVPESHISSDMPGQDNGDDCIIVDSVNSQDTVEEFPHHFALDNSVISEHMESVPMDAVVCETTTGSSIADAHFTGPLTSHAEDGLNLAINSDGLPAGVIATDENGQLVLRNIDGLQGSALDSIILGDQTSPVVPIPIQFTADGCQVLPFTIQSNGTVGIPGVPDAMNVGDLPLLNILPADVIETVADTVEVSAQLQEESSLQSDGMEIYVVDNGNNSNDGQVVVTSESQGHSAMDVKSFMADDPTNGQGGAVPGPSGYIFDRRMMQENEEGEQSRRNFVRYVDLPKFAPVDENACVLCGKKYKRKEELKLHLRLHARETVEVFECPICHDQYGECYLLRRHMAEHGAEDGDKICSMCGAKFKQKEELGLHNEWVHHINEAFPCSSCEMKFTCSDDLRMHRKEQLCLRNSFGCELCGSRFSTKESLKHHVTNIKVREKSVSVSVSGHVKQLDGRTCGICGRIFSRPYRLKQHMETHEGEAPAAEMPGLSLDGGDAEPETKPVDINGGIPDDLKPKKQRGASCDICGRRFRRLYCLRQHLLTHKEYPVMGPGRGPSKSAACHVCGRHFDRPSRLLRHMQSHATTMPSMPLAEPPPLDHDTTCNICGQDFFLQKDLELHLEQHITNTIDRSGQFMDVTSSPIKLGHKKTCPECKRNCYTWPRYNNHYCVRPVVGQGYPCKYCDKYFPTLVSVCNHVATHRTYKPPSMVSEARKSSTSRRRTKDYDVVEEGFQCRICDRIFPKVNSILCHMSSHKEKAKDTECVCTKCSGTFPSIETLRLHLRTCLYETSSTSNSTANVKVEPTSQLIDVFVCNSCQECFPTCEQLESHSKECCATGVVS